MKKYILNSLTIILLALSVNAFATFIVRDIRIQGLQGISKNTVYNYLPVQIGDRITQKKSSEIIQGLYKTGFFENVSLAKQGHTLVINVVQRAIISRLTVKGNKAIPDKKLMDALRKLNFAEGQVFNPSILAKIKTSLAREYFAVGKYNAHISVKVTPRTRNRVDIKIVIFEGAASKLHQIKIIGNHAFTEKQLSSQFTLHKSTVLSFLTHSDQYSKQKLNADLETLRSYYMDRGYIDFRILSTQVSISPNRKQIYIAVHVHEGSQYRVKGYALTGKTILSKREIRKFIYFHQGAIFSRRNVMRTNKAIVDKLGNQGYARATVNIGSKIDRQNNTIFLTIKVVPGRRVYIRHVSFSGNYRTNDSVLRRNLFQQEGGLISTKKIEDSKRFLMLQPFIQDVQVSSTPVPGVKDQMDVDFKVTEHKSNELKAGMGFSMVNKFTVNAALNQRNVLGTGNTFGINLNIAHASSYLNLSYYNPYSTQSGIGRSISAYASYFSADKVNITNYATNNYGFNVAYFLRVSKNGNFHLGYGYENILVKLGNDENVTKEVSGFAKEYGQHFYSGLLNAGYTYQGLDRSIFPTRGLLQKIDLNVSAPISHDQSLQYYKLDYMGLYFQPVYKNFILKVKGHIRYGDSYGRFGGHLPFFKNFYAGGMGTVRGYSGNSLGPKDSKGNALGGNFALDGSLNLIFPNPISNTIRTSVFYDFGNVYDGVAFNMRTSAGIQIDWMSPMAIFNFSFAKAINPHLKHGHVKDDTEVFAFTMNSSY